MFFQLSLVLSLQIPAFIVFVSHVKILKSIFWFVFCNQFCACFKDNLDNLFLVIEMSRTKSNRAFLSLFTNPKTVYKVDDAFESDTVVQWWLNKFSKNPSCT